MVLWVLAYGLLKAFSLSSLDIDSAEQVYFAQSWQLGYGTRQPPLYTWLVLAFKPASASWLATLEVARYGCLLLWFAGVQALSSACGASRSVQARVLLAHLGVLLVMWRVHDSLTHTVLAGAITVWGSVAVLKAVTDPRYWLLAGLLGGLACLSKLNAALWCVSSFVAAWLVISANARSKDKQSSHSVATHLVWMAAALLIFLAVLAPYAHWWLTHSKGTVALARRIVVSDENLPMWDPLIEVVVGVLEYLLIAPVLLVALAWGKRRKLAHGQHVLGEYWLTSQMLVGLLLLVVVLTIMKASHFTPRWLWPVVPGATVWLSMRGIQALDDLGDARLLRVADRLLWTLALLSVAMVGVRFWEPAYNAQKCHSCWTDRPAEQLSAELHRRYGELPMRFITGDDHLAGILVQVAPQDKAWTAISPDLPPPDGFGTGASPCVVVWLDVDAAKPAPLSLAAWMASGTHQPVQSSQWPLRLNPKRAFRLQSALMSPDVCAKVPL
jgi:hypothetical protein